MTRFGWAGIWPALLGGSMESGRLAVVAAIVSLLAVGGAHATTYDLAEDFSLGGNPNGPYTYGSTTTLGGVLSVYANSATFPLADAWGGGAGGGIPNVFLNDNAFESTDGFTTMRPGQLAFHPSFGDLHSVIRFTVPATGLYEIDAAYEGISTAGTTSRVFILMNGVNWVLPPGKKEMQAAGNASDQRRDLTDGSKHVLLDDG